MSIICSWLKSMGTAVIFHLLPVLLPQSLSASRDWGFECELAKDYSSLLYSCSKNKRTLFWTCIHVRDVAMIRFMELMINLNRTLILHGHFQQMGFLGFQPIFLSRSITLTSSLWRFMWFLKGKRQAPLQIHVRMHKAWIHGVDAILCMNGKLLQNLRILVKLWYNSIQFSFSLQKLWTIGSCGIGWMPMIQTHHIMIFEKGKWH